MIDINREKPLKVADVAYKMRVHKRTVEGWFKRGLERIQLGGLIYTTEEALQRFAMDKTTRNSAATTFSSSTKESMDAGRQLEAQFGV